MKLQECSGGDACSGDDMSATAARKSDGGVTEKGRIGGGRVKDGLTVADRSWSKSDLIP